MRRQPLGAQPVRSRSNLLLNDGEVACLLLAADHLTSKEIALRLGISPHTVDKRMRKALRLLGTRTRREAVRVLQSREPCPRVLNRRAAGEQELEAASSARARFSLSGMPLPIATKARSQNVMSIGLRLFWIFAIAFSAFVSSITYLAGLESLARLLK